MGYRTALTILFAILILGPDSTQAAGMSDYWLEIAPGYYIVRANGFAIGLGDADGSVIYSPDRGGQSGPVTGYIVAPHHIFLRTTGQKARNHFPGDTFPLADPSVEYFFVVDRSDNALHGPLTLDEFNADSNVALLSSVDWKIPANPHPGRMPWLFYVVIFLYLALPILLFILIVLVISKGIRMPISKRATNQESGSGG
ncbi:hypothetical protein Pan258_33810 [Symmachiella dynata]|uniref:hypothetical protein n=1 Tax=Symmachiella dynata TaxID=2527995 RepID=UPI00118D193D|nr:hypothetical protein [Symmachiella dynata]QDT49332.1 hypothetical protein Pan258_33810 [Symmachiella dynata]